MNVEKKIVNGKVAVLYSPDYGAGWSTWAGDIVRDFLLFDKTIVEMAERGAKEKEVSEYLKSIPETKNVYTGGWRDIAITWVPVGTAFRINEYDGKESFEYIGDVDWSVA